MKIAFIGLGIMGKPMAKNLIKAGYELFVFDRNPAANEEMKAAGANICASSADTVKNVDLVITMLPNSPQRGIAVTWRRCDRCQLLDRADGDGSACREDGRVFDGSPDCKAERRTSGTGRKENGLSYDSGRIC